MKKRFMKKELKGSERFISYWLPVIIWASLIFYLSSLPYVAYEVTPVERPPAFVEHMIGYFILAVFLYRPLSTNEKLKKNVFFLTILFTLLYGISDEIHQIFVPGRVFSFTDIFANFLGGFLIIVVKFKRKRMPLAGFEPATPSS